MSLNQSAIAQWCWGFHTLRGGIDPGNLRFRPRVVGFLYIYGRVSDLEMGIYSPRVRRDLGVGPGGNSRRALAP